MTRQKLRKGLLTFSAMLFPLMFFFMSPYIIVEAASQGILNGSDVVFGLLLLFSVLGSRLFCGWLCPAGAIQDQVAQSRPKPWNSKGKNAPKYVIWVVWFAFSVYLWLSNRPLKADLLYMTGIDIYALITYFTVTTVIYVFALLTDKRGMCHSLCWMAPFMAIGEKCADILHLPRFRLASLPDRCISCGQCSKRCPMSLDVESMVKRGSMDSLECISCLECVDNCPQKAIRCGMLKRQSP